MAPRFVAVATLLVATFLTSAASAEEKPLPRLGSIVVPGTGGRLLSLVIKAFHRPPATPPTRLMGWLPLPPELPRATVATLYKLTF